MSEPLSGVFSQEERRFVKMLDDGGILVGDRWFPAESSELDRLRYRAACLRRDERNRRRRERYRAKAGAPRPRNVRGHVAYDLDSQRANRLLLERRKCLRRSTVAPCPTPNEIRAAWNFRKGSPKAELRLAGLLLDLECYVDNSLKVVFRRNRPGIRGRRGGIRGWIRENCPELEGKYKTLMRIKGKGKCLRQNLLVPDPVPLSFLLDPSADPEELASRPLHVQPRADDDGDAPGLVANRFAWELSQVNLDFGGREFRDNGNYLLVTRSPGYIRTDAKRLVSLRAALGIILNGPEKRAIENYTVPFGRVPSVPSSRRAPVRARAGADGAVGGGFPGGSWISGGGWASGRRRRAGVRPVSFGTLLLEGLESYFSLPYRMTRLWPTIPLSELENEW